MSFWVATPARSIELQFFEYPSTRSVPTVASSPSWSPNGEYLAYVEFAYFPYSISDFDLGVANFHHEFLAWLPVGIVSLYNIASPTWSPDGRRIAYFYRSEYGAQTGIYTVGESSGPAILLSRPNAEGIGCDWSPSGDTIAFAERDSLWLATVEVPSIRLLTTGIADKPSWSPDGGSLVFSSTRSGNYELWVLDIATSGVRQLTNHEAEDREPDWSPNGHWIAFSSNRRGHYDLWVMPVSGGEAIPLTDDEARDGEPAWSPSGDRIAFWSDREHPDPNQLRGGIWIASQLPDMLTDIAPRSWTTIKNSYRPAP